jgi:hypothetical protein
MLCTGMQAKFATGQLVCTPTVAELLAQSGVTVEQLLARHQSGDWGDISAVQREMNERAIQDHCSIESCHVFGHQRVAVITKADRSMTLIHLDVRKHH